MVACVETGCLWFALDGLGQFEVGGDENVQLTCLVFHQHNLSQDNSQLFKD